MKGASLCARSSWRSVTVTLPSTVHPRNGLHRKLGRKTLRLIRLAAKDINATVIGLYYLAFFEGNMLGSATSLEETA
ncbi:MAG: hypothetical protein HOC23_17930 [Halieaceae bacterium]|nr:hypothetical protein [Halieaceae bacterium]